MLCTRSLLLRTHGTTDLKKDLLHAASPRFRSRVLHPVMHGPIKPCSHLTAFLYPRLLQPRSSTSPFKAQKLTEHVVRCGTLSSRVVTLFYAEIDGLATECLFQEWRLGRAGKPSLRLAQEYGLRLHCALLTRLRLYLIWSRLLDVKVADLSAGHWPKQTPSRASCAGVKPQSATNLAGVFTNPSLGMFDIGCL